MMRSTLWYVLRFGLNHGWVGGSDVEASGTLQANASLQPKSVGSETFDAISQTAVAQS